MIKINVDQICEVRILDKRPHPYYEYRPAKKSFIWGNRAEGFYDTLTMGDPELTPVEDIEKGGELMCIDQVVYFRPRIFIHMNNGEKKYKYFDTKEEAIEYFQKSPEFAGIKWADNICD